MTKRQDKALAMQLGIALQNMTIRLNIGLEIELERISELKIKELKLNLQKQQIDFNSRIEGLIR